MGVVLSNLLSLRGILRAQSAMRGLMVAVAVALLTFTVALFGGFLHATRIADEATMESERNLLSSHISVTERGILAAQKIQESWDEAMLAAGGQGETLDTRWVDTYFGQFLWNNLHTDFLFLTAPDGKLLRAWQHGKPAVDADYAPVERMLRDERDEMASNRAVDGTPARFRRLADTEWPYNAENQPMVRMASQLGEYHGQPAILTIVSIIPDHDFGLLRRTPNNLVAVRLIDREILAGIGRDLLLKDLVFTPSMKPDPGRNHLELVDQDGGRIGWLSWKPNNVGPMIVRQTTPLLLGYLAFYVLVLAGGVMLVRQAIQLAREYAAREARAHRSAMHDPMLGLPNRTMVMQRMSKLLAEIEVEGGDQALVLAYIDLDHFKSINESIGHHVGDELLVDVSRRLRAILSEGDMLGRIASDEFVILHRVDNKGDGKSAADALGKRVVGVFSEPFHIMGHTVVASASCGLAWGPDQANDATELLRLADIALFRAKQRGRGRYRYFTEDMNASIRWRQDMELELRRAITADDLTMLYQPIVNVADRRIVSFESLLRWNHRDRGAISPSVFVPLAEQSGLMPMLGDWVLRRVFSDCASMEHVEISVNLSPLQITARDFVPNLQAMVREYHVDPRRFVFEVTEGVLLESSERVLSRLEQLRDMGFRIALDDFGTGYSSLAYLRSFQFDRIKVDRAFVQGIESDLDALAILKTIVTLGRTLRMKVIAEGVETLLQQQLVEASGCELIQGHLHWRAMPIERASALVSMGSPSKIRLAG